MRVSILTRPEGRMQSRSRCPNDCCRTCFNPHPARRPDAIPMESVSFNGGTVHVSILTRPEGRMQLAGFRVSGPWFVFQSSPGQKAGCNQPIPAIYDPRRFVSILTRPEGRMQCLYLNFLSVLREPPDTGFSICFHCPDHFFPTATIQLRTRTYKLQWLQHVVRVRPPAVP